MPESVLVQIEDVIKTDKHRGHYISVTGLLGCMRQTFLERSIDYYLEPAKSWWKLRGKIVHSLLEGSQGISDWYTEIEYKYLIGDFDGVQYWLRGTIDVLRPLAQKILDYKTMGDKGLVSLKFGLKKDHIMQFNMYRFLVLRGSLVDETLTLPKIDDITDITSYYMTMMQVANSGGVYEEDTIYRDSDPEHYPNEVSRTILSERTDLVLKKGKRKAKAIMDDYEVKTKRRWRLTYRIPSVPLLPLDDIEAFIKSMAPHMVNAFSKGTVPPMCDPETRIWKCNYCAAVKECDIINEKDGVKRMVEQEIENGIPVITL